jgi:hypothetical protein
VAGFKAATGSLHRGFLGELDRRLGLDPMGHEAGKPFTRGVGLLGFRALGDRAVGNL